MVATTIVQEPLRSVWAHPFRIPRPPRQTAESAAANKCPKVLLLLLLLLHRHTLRLFLRCQASPDAAKHLHLRSGSAARLECLKASLAEKHLSSRTRARSSCREGRCREPYTSRRHTVQVRSSSEAAAQHACGFAYGEMHLRECTCYCHAGDFTMGLTPLQVPQHGV